MTKSLVTFLIICLTLTFSITAQEKINSPQYYTSKDEKYLTSIIKNNLDNKSSDSDKILGIAYHQLAVLNKKEASENAVNYLNKYIEKTPNDYLALAFLGSAYTMLARDSFAIYKKFSYVNKGLEFLDESVDHLPNDFFIRLIRGNVTYQLPNMFERKLTAYDDFKYLVNNYKNQINDISEIYYKLGSILKNENRINEANYYFGLAYKSNQNSAWGIKAKDELND